MKNYRAYAIGLLALLTGSLVVAAALLLASGDNNPPIQILPPSSERAVGAAGSGGPATSSLISNATDLKVYISGAVRSPGVYALQPGNRLAEALDAAGGATAGADLAAVNLALRVQDEGYYYIPVVGETPPAAASPLEGAGQGASSAPSSSQGAGRGLLDLNTATLEDLGALPGIGPVRAQAIIDHRDRNGPFISVTGIIDVAGIGMVTYEKIQDLVTAGAP